MLSNNNSKYVKEELSLGQVDLTRKLSLIPPTENFSNTYGNVMNMDKTTFIFCINKNIEQTIYVGKFNIQFDKNQLFDQFLLQYHHNL